MPNRVYEALTSLNCHSIKEAGINLLPFQKCANLIVREKKIKEIDGEPKEKEPLMNPEAGKRIGEIKVKKYLVKNDNTLLRLEEATIKICTLPEEKAKSRECTELGQTKGRECEELVLVYRPSGCIREKNEIDLNEVTTVKATTSKN